MPPTSWSTTGGFTGRRWRRFLGARGRWQLTQVLAPYRLSGSTAKATSLRRWTRQLRRLRHLRGSNIEEHVYPGAQHEVLNEINKEEVLDDVVRFLRGA